METAEQLLNLIVWISGEQKTIKGARIMDVHWSFVGMHYVKKKLVKKNEILLLNCGYFFSFQQCLAHS